MRTKVERRWRDVRYLIKDGRVSASNKRQAGLYIQSKALANGEAEHCDRSC